MLQTKKPYFPPTIRQNLNAFRDKQPQSGFSSSTEKLEGVDIADLIATHGSPLFVFSERVLREKYREAYRAFSTRYPKVQFAWSYKTNYLNAICSVFHQAGAIAEVVSDFEYEKARQLGIRGDQIILNGPYKNEALLRRAIAEKALIQIDNLQELSLLQQLTKHAAEPHPVAIRVNMETGFEQTWTKFGFSFEAGGAEQAIQRIAECSTLRLVGLHMHIGTFVLDPKCYGIAVEKLARVAKVAREQWDIELEYVNVGGGFASRNTLHAQYLPAVDATPTFAQYADVICAALRKHWPESEHPPQLYLETGRALVDEAGWLLATVLDARSTPDGRRSVIVDAGVNILYTASWYKFDIQPAQPNSGPISPTIVYGPLCMNIDVVRDGAPLPPLRPGEQIVIHPVGAYNVTQSMQFITYRPAVLLIAENGQVEVIRDREDLSYVQSLERIPSRLQASETEHEEPIQKGV
jgi:diaminopimelate decarboxylase